MKQVTEVFWGPTQLLQQIKLQQSPIAGTLFINGVLTLNGAYAALVTFNGLLQQPDSDYVMSGQIVLFSYTLQQPGCVQVVYWVAA